MSINRNLARLVVDATGAISTTNLGNATSEIADGSITAAKLASGAAVGNIGYTPANKAGDAFTGAVTVDGAFTASGNVTAYGSV